MNRYNLVEYGMILIFIGAIINFIVLVTTQKKNHYIISILIMLLGLILGIIGILT